jgi:tetratricopeptide (TPR) repeat protein
VAVVSLVVLAVAEGRANRDLAAALEAETEARGDSVTQADIAHNAIRLFYTGLTRDVMLQRPELTDLRNRLLGTALEFYQKFSESLQNAPARSKDSMRLMELARALESIASIQALLGQKDEAIANRSRAVVVYDSIDAPGTAPAAAEALLNLGNAQRMAGRPDDAIRSLRDALARFERLNAGGATNVKVALALADLGRMLSDSGRGDEAREALERARDLQEPLVRNSRVTAFPHNLGATLTTLGNLHGNEQRLADSLQAYEEATKLYEGLFAKGPKEPFTRAELARSLNNLGLALARTGRSKEGLDTAERGMKLRSDLLADQPLNIEYRSDLARSHFHLALIQVLARQQAGAIKSIAKAEELYTGIPPKGPEDIYFQACLSAMRAGLVAGGKPDTELSLAERAERLHFGDLAMARLKQARAAGYWPAGLLASDPALDSLRGRLDFQEMLRSVSK